MKKTMTFLLIVALVFTMPFTSKATNVDSEEYIELQEGSVYMSATDKRAFAEEKDALYEATHSSGKIVSESKETIDRLMADVTFATGDKRENLLQELEKYGVYLYNDNNNTAQPRSDSSGVTLNAPNVFYSSSANTWTVSHSGSWKNNSWLEQTASGNVGGPDAFGVAYTNTSNYATYVVGASAYITDRNSDTYKTTSNRSDGDGSRGFGFRLQDYYAGSYTYIGYRWYGSCTYNSNFANFSGVATAYYMHTWSSTSINSISFTGGTSGVGITATFSGDNRYFSAYSSDTPF